MPVIGLWFCVAVAAVAAVVPPAGGMADWEVLSELPLSALLAQKKALQGACPAQERPQALPLLGQRLDKRLDPLDHMQVKGLHTAMLDRGHFVEEEEEEEEIEYEMWMPMGKGKGKLESLFNGSLTALAFLAFGGYLLCLVVNAIKEKKEMQQSSMMSQQQQSLLFQQLLQNRPFPVPLRNPILPVAGGRRRRAVAPHRPRHNYSATSRPSVHEMLDLTHALAAYIAAPTATSPLHGASRQL